MKKDRAIKILAAAASALMLMFSACPVYAVDGEHPAEEAQPEGEFAEGAVLVNFSSFGESESAELAGLGYTVGENLTPALGLEMRELKVRAGSTEDEACGELMALSYVKSAERVGVLRMEDGGDGSANPEEEQGVSGYSLAAVNDPSLSRQWYLDYVNAFEAQDFVRQWAAADGNSLTKTRVAVIDSGADYNHPDLTNIVNKTLSYDVINNCPLVNNGNCGDVNAGGHGTGVCSVMAAEANNGYGIAGVCAKECIDLVVIAACRGNYAFQSTDVIAGVNYALANGCRLINMSFAYYLDDYGTALETVVQSAYEHGVLCICAAGNEGNDRRMTPGDSKYALSVISTDSYTDPTTNPLSKRFTIGGSPIGTASCYGENKDVTAGGNEMYTATPTSSGSFRWWSGTSMATPAVTATAAMMLSIDPSLSPGEVYSIITGTAVDLYTPGFDIYTANGKTDALAAVTAAAQTYVEPASIAVTGLGKVCTGRTARYSAAFSPAGVWKRIRWSVTNGTGTATVTEYGALKALTAGTVTLKATCEDAPTVVAEKTVTISNNCTVSVTFPADGYTYSSGSLWADGVQRNGTIANRTVSASMPQTTKVITAYKIKNNIPYGMYVWFLKYNERTGFSAVQQTALTDLLTYHGYSIRVAGYTGIRFRTGIDISTKNALISAAGFNGFKLKEYGNVVMKAANLGTLPFVIGGEKTSYGKAYWTENGRTNDIVFETAGGRQRFTTVLINIAEADFKTEYVFRGAAVLTAGKAEYTIYGPPVSRSIYTVAGQIIAAGEFAPGTSQYNFVRHIRDVGDAQ